MPRNFFNSVAQDFGMVIIKKSDTDGHRFFHDIGAIIGPSNANFNQGNVHFLFNEHVKGHDSEKFEVSRFFRTNLVVDFPEIGGKNFLGQRLAINSDSLSGGNQVRRRIKSCFKALIKGSLRILV